MGLLEKTEKKTYFNYEQNPISIFKKITITKPSWHQIKPKQNNLTYTSLEKICDLFSMQPGTGQQKKQERAKFKEVLFSKTLKFKVIKIFNYQLKSYVHLYLHRKQLRLGQCTSDY